MRQLQIALCSSEATSEILPQELSWGSLFELLSEFSVREPKSGPAWVPASFRQPRRLTQHAAALELLVFDLDETSEPELDALATRLEAEGRAFVIHSTHSHTDSAGCARLVLPLARPVQPAEVLSVRQQAAHELQIHVDAKTHDIARLYFLPSARPGAPTLHYARLEGSWYEPRQAPAVVDLSSQFKAAARMSADDRAVFEPFLSGSLRVKAGERDNTIHKVMSLFVAAGDTPPSEAMARDLLERMLDKMECEPEGREFWLRKALYSFERGVAHRKKTQDALDKMRVAVSNVQQAVASGEEWRTKLLVEKSKEGNPVGFKSVGVNLALILANDEAFRGRVRWNVLTKRIEITGGPLSAECYDTLDVAVANWLQASTYSITLPRHEVAAQLMLVARQAEFDPIQSYLSGLPEWDRKPRLDQLLLRHAGAQGNPEFIAQATRKFFISAVARAMKPGAKVDTMLLLHGPQGIGKSQFVSAIASPWSTSARLDIYNKDSVLIMTGNWLVELAEMASLRGRDLESVKAFLSSPSDQLRVPYGRAVEDYPRRSVFVGTTNDDQPLSDPTGNRRYWPVSVTHIDVDAIRAQREQLWAEALSAYKEGERWWFSVAEEPVVASETDVYRQDDPLPEVLLHWYVKKPKPRPQFMTTRDIAAGALFMMPSDMNNGTTRRIGQALRGLGFKVVRMRTVKNGPQLPHWEAPSRLREAELQELRPEAQTNPLEEAGT